MQKTHQRHFVLALAAIICLAVLVRLGHAQAQPETSAAQAVSGNAENGKKLYNTIGCWQCHGYSGQGGAAPKIAPDPISFQNFTRFIRIPRSAMPPYSPKVVSDAQLADIYAYLKTIPKPPDPKSIPLLNSD